MKRLYFVEASLATAVTSVAAVAHAAVDPFANTFPLPTPAPPLQLAARQQPQDSRFFGFSTTTSGASWQAFSCSSDYYWSTSDSFGRCCLSSWSTCTFLTACSNSFVVAPGTSQACSDSQICNTHSILQSLGDTRPTKWIGCAAASEAGKQFYVTPPVIAASTTTSTSKSASTSTSTVVTARPTTAPRFTTSTSIASPVATSPTGTGDNQPKGKSKTGLIVGLSIGVAAVLIIAGLAYLFLRRRKRSMALSAVAEKPVVQQSFDPNSPHDYQQSMPSPPIPWSPAPTYTQFGHQPGSSPPIISPLHQMEYFGGAYKQPGVQEQQMQHHVYYPHYQAQPAELAATTAPPKPVQLP